jgi:hypothetical protein
MALRHADLSIDFVNEYPYGERPLAIAWSDRKSQLLVILSVLLCALASWMQWPVALARLDDWALRVLFPALLAIVLALAPRPATRVGRIAKDLTVLTILAAIFGGNRVPLMIACFPLVLAAAVIVGDDDR